MVVVVVVVVAISMIAFRGSVVALVLLLFFSSSCVQKISQIVEKVFRLAFAVAIAANVAGRHCLVRALDGTARRKPWRTCSSRSSRGTDHKEPRLRREKGMGMADVP